MKKTVRAVTVLLFITGMIFTVTGCGKKTSDEKAGETTAKVVNETAEKKDTVAETEKGLEKNTGPVNKEKSGRKSRSLKGGKAPEYSPQK